MADVNVSEQLAFDKIKIGLASPETIRKWATRKVGDKEVLGEVTKPETINYIIPWQNLHPQGANPSDPDHG